MIRRLLMTIVFFIVLVGTAHATIITYYYSGTLFSARNWSTIRSGDMFTGSFSYDDTQPFSSYGSPIVTGNYLTDLSLTIGNDTVFKNNANFNVRTDSSGGSLDLNGYRVSGEMDGITSDQPNSLHVWMSDTQKFDDTGLPDANLTRSDFRQAHMSLNLDVGTTYYALDGPINYLSTVNPAAAPVPEPCTMLLLGTGLAGLGLYRRKIK